MNEPSAAVASEPKGDLPSILRARWRIIVLLMAFAFVSHINRISMPTAGNARIMAQYEISPTRMGFVYSAFLFTYTLCMIPGGIVLDRWGARVALMVVGFGSAVFATLTGSVGWLIPKAAVAITALMVVRGVMGIVSAPLHPSLARAVGDWVPPGGRSRINGLVNGTALVGIAITPLFFGELINRFDWPAAFLVMAVITTILTIVWAVFSSDRPEGSSAGPASERATEPRDLEAPWHALFNHRGLVLLTISYGAVGYFQYLFFYWMDHYFQKVLHIPETRSRIYVAIPTLAMAIGMPLGGWLADHVEQVFGAARSRKFVPMAGMTAGALLLIVGVFASDPRWIVLWFSLALGAVGMAEGPFWSTAIELGGRRGGSSAALLNFGGNAGGWFAPIMTPWVGSILGWGYAVILGGLICLSGVILWIWIDPNERLPERAI